MISAAISLFIKPKPKLFFQFRFKIINRYLLTKRKRTNRLTGIFEFFYAAKRAKGLSRRRFGKCCRRFF